MLKVEIEEKKTNFMRLRWFHRKHIKKNHETQFLNKPNIKGWNWKKNWIIKWWNWKKNSIKNDLKIEPSQLRSTC
jgi:hypothetical protein